MRTCLPRGRLFLVAMALAINVSAVQGQEPEVGFEDLSRLTDREIQVLLRQVDQLDLVMALKGGGEPIKEKCLSNMSDRVRGYIEYEIRFASPSPDQIVEVQRRILDQARLLAEQGHIAWPPGRGEARRRAELVDDWSRQLQYGLTRRLRRPFSELGFAEIAGVMRDMGELARRQGILALEEVIYDNPRIIDVKLRSYYNL